MIYLQLFLVFAKIGLFGFGGGMAMLPMIYQGAKTFGLMSADEFSNLVAISQVTPGPIAVNAATYVGFNCAGYSGAAVATFGVALPSFILVTLACYFEVQRQRRHRRSVCRHTAGYRRTDRRFCDFYGAECVRGAGSCSHSHCSRYGSSCGKI